MRRSIGAPDRLGHILEAIEKARLAVGGVGLEEYRRDSMRRLATERAIEILSEASRHIPDELKATEPDITWRDIADVGSIIRHVYDSVDPDIVEGGPISARRARRGDPPHARAGSEFLSPAGLSAWRLLG